VYIDITVRTTMTTCRQWIWCPRRRWPILWPILCAGAKQKCGVFTSRSHVPWQKPQHSRQLKLIEQTKLNKSDESAMCGVRSFVRSSGKRWSLKADFWRSTVLIARRDYARPGRSSRSFVLARGSPWWMSKINCVLMWPSELPTGRWSRCDNPRSTSSSVRKRL